MNNDKHNITEDEMIFAVTAIGATAQKMRLKQWSLKKRLQDTQLLDEYLIKHYDTLHTQSIDHAAQFIIGALKNRTQHKA